MTLCAINKEPLYPPSFCRISSSFRRGICFFAIGNNNNLFIEAFLKNLPLKESGSTVIHLLIDALLVLVLAISSALFFSFKKAQTQGVRIWTPISKRLLLNFLVPLMAGGLFIIILCISNQWQLIVPSMLIFYGLALVNAGKFTYGEVFYLGIAEIFIGFVSALLPEFALFSWCFGFGILHIVYGLFMYRKYDV